ncbi:MarR family transcriptional regulator [Natronomonas sp. F2-12]|jgi:DNA-binding MarR family transcriptional regulator|uniref:MarR family transcriptional regulator n=1 Tax=Natronomonas aquatica TaxID=2841590 RepID=A0A9R1CVN5_9EURY|nr:helix-turn-helix domain-containing protein [Natronomonas aquatica]MCQ4334431.1 MarR family transcriptional regulator [Natronomonas aquatica]
MSILTSKMVNENFEPNERQEAILDVLKENREEEQPWGYANPKRLEEELGIRRQYINRALNGLVDAGWVEKVNRGLYRFVADPREI